MTNILPPQTGNPELDAYLFEVQQALQGGNLGAAVTVATTAAATAVAAGGGITVLLTNENHTFTAVSTGAVSDTARDAFRTDIIVFEGIVQLAYNANRNALADGEYTIDTANINYSSQGTPITLSAPTAATVNDVVVARFGVITIPNTVNTEVVTIPLIIRQEGEDIEYDATIRFSKAIGGSAESLNIVASRQYFTFANSTITSSSDSSITITADYDGGDTGDFVWTRVVNGGSQESVANTTGSLTVTSSDFGNSRNIVYTVNRGGVSDSLTIASLRNGDRGEQGEPAIDILIETRMRPTEFPADSNDAADSVDPAMWPRSSDGFYFRNNQGAEKTLVAFVFIGGVEATNTQHQSFGYTWTRNGVSFNPTDTTAALNSRWLPVDANDVEDGGQDLFEVSVNTNPSA